MLDIIKESFASQFQAALCTLSVCIDRCPEASWHEKVGNLRFCQVALHTLLFADLYLSVSEDQEAFKAQPFHREHAGVFQDYEEFGHQRVQQMTYEKPFIAAYVQVVRKKIEEAIAAETEASLVGPTGFSWRTGTRAEHHVYNTRHIQHHAAQFSLRLRIDHGIVIPWIGRGWKEV
jgi:hypothetical protein